MMTAKPTFGAYRQPGTTGAVPQSGPASPYAHRVSSSGFLIAANATATSTLKKLTIPSQELSTSSSKTFRLNRKAWDLYNSKNRPEMTDVEQGNIQNCPLASIIAALAHTASGRKHIGSMIQERKGANTVTSYTGSNLDGPRAVRSSRYFVVTFPGKSPIEVSDVFYTGDSKEKYLIYMTSPNKVLWPAVIEKAYAKWKGGYDNLGNDPIKVWKELVGEPKYLDLRVSGKDRVRTSQVIREAGRANKVPMIAAREGSYHGVVVTDNKGATSISYYDQYSVVEKSIKVSDLRTKDPTLIIYGPIRK